MGKACTHIFSPEPRTGPLCNQPDASLAAKDQLDVLRAEQAWTHNYKGGSSGGHMLMSHRVSGRLEGQLLAEACTRTILIAVSSGGTTTPHT